MPHQTKSLTGKELDYWMYYHACKTLEKTPSRETFETDYTQGKFHFYQDKALLVDLMHQHNIRIQRLAGEWLASTESASAYGDCPLSAACRLVLFIHFGPTTPEN